MKISWRISVFLAAAVIGSALARSGDSPPLAHAYAGFPLEIDSKCRDGKAQIFDECGDQLALFKNGSGRARIWNTKCCSSNSERNGASWCHVFDAHINGEHHRFTYTYGTPDEPESRQTTTFKEGKGADARAANALREFVAANFVIVHIDAAYAPNSDHVLEASGASERYDETLPFIFSVDQRGKFAQKFMSDAVEKRRDTESDWYRGYDRAGLLAQLTSMRDAARASVP
jgi:hypothetical protein